MSTFSRASADGWPWDEQLKPTVKEAASPESLTILGSMLGASLAMRPFDPQINDYRNSGQMNPINDLTLQATILLLLPPLPL